MVKSIVKLNERRNWIRRLSAVPLKHTTDFFCYHHCSNIVFFKLIYLTLLDNRISGLSLVEYRICMDYGKIILAVVYKYFFSTFFFTLQRIDNEVHKFIKLGLDSFYSHAAGSHVTNTDDVIWRVTCPRTRRACPIVAFHRTRQA